MSDMEQKRGGGGVWQSRKWGRFRCKVKEEKAVPESEERWNSNERCLQSVEIVDGAVRLETLKEGGRGKVCNGQKKKGLGGHRVGAM